MTVGRKLSLALGASNPKRYLKSALWVIFTRILSILVSLISIFYVARTLGPQNFGELNYAVSTVGLLGFFAALASSAVIRRDLVKKPDKQIEILGTAWFVTFFGTIFTILSVLVLILFLPHDNITLYIIGLLCLAQLFATFQVTQNFFFATAETKYLSLTQLGIHLGVSLAKIVAMTLNQGVLVLAMILLLEQFFSALIMILIYIKHTNIWPTEWRVNKNYAKQLVIDSIPFVFITMSVVVSGRIDQVLLRHFIDVTTVGLYSVAVQLTELWQVVPQILLASLFPALVNSHQSQNAYGRRISFLVILLAGYSLIASLGTYILAPIFVPLIYGQEFLASIPLLQIYVWSLFGTIAGFLVTDILITENQRRIQIIVGIIPMILNIILNLIWIPQFGAAGAAWATVLSYSITPLIPLFYISIWSRILTSEKY